MYAIYIEAPEYQEDAPSCMALGDVREGRYVTFTDTLRRETLLMAQRQTQRAATTGRSVETPVAMFANWGPADQANAIIEAVPPGGLRSVHNHPRPLPYRPHPSGGGARAHHDQLLRGITGGDSKPARTTLVCVPTSLARQEDQGIGHGGELRPGTADTHTAVERPDDHAW